MDMSVPTQRYLKNRRDRALGTIMGAVERSDFWGDLTAEEQDSFRKSVIDALNSYHDSVLDLVKAEDSTRNEETVKLLERLERAISRVEARPGVQR
jgi:hypothetical protein